MRYVEPPILFGYYSVACVFSDHLPSCTHEAQQVCHFMDEDSPPKQ